MEECHDECRTETPRDVCITTESQQFCHNLSGHAFPLPPLSFPQFPGGNPGKKHGCPTGALGHDKIICHSREGGNPVFSMVSWISVFTGMAKRQVVQSCRRVEESVIENRKELLHIVEKFEKIQRNSRKTQSNVKVKDLTPSTSTRLLRFHRCRGSCHQGCPRPRPNGRQPSKTNRMDVCVWRKIK